MSVRTYVHNEHITYVCMPMCINNTTHRYVHTYVCVCVCLCVCTKVWDCMLCVVCVMVPACMTFYMRACACVCMCWCVSECAHVRIGLHNYVYVYESVRVCVWCM